MPASATLLQAVMVTAELCGYSFTSESVATVFIEDLAGCSEPLVLRRSSAAAWSIRAG